MLKHFTLRLKNRLRKFEKSEQGVAAIEFAMLGPPFLMLMGVMVETGLMMLAEYSIQEGVSEAARLVRTGQVQANSTDAAAFKKAICSTAGIIVGCSENVYVYVRAESNFKELGNKLPKFNDIGPGPNPKKCYNPGQPSQAAAVVATYDWTFKMFGMSFLGTVNNGAARRLVGFAIFQNEPFPTSPFTSC